jgi:hypothetical protein
LIVADISTGLIPVVSQERAAAEGFGGVGAGDGAKENDAAGEVVDFAKLRALGKAKEGEAVVPPKGMEVEEGEAVVPKGVEGAEESEPVVVVHENTFHMRTHSTYEHILYYNTFYMKTHTI